MDSYGMLAAALAASSAAPSSRARFGQLIHEKSAWMLGDYMDEVEQQVSAMDVHVRALEHAQKPTDHCPQSFFGSWNQFVNAPTFGRYDTGRPYGWRAYYRDHRGLLSRVFTSDPLWAETAAYEDELIRLYDWAAACGGKPPTTRPTPGHQPPPPSQTPEGQLKSALGTAAFIAGIFAVGYLLRGLPAKAAA